MYNNHFELVGDDLFVNFLMDQPQNNFPHVNSNSNIHYPLWDNDGQPQQEFLLPNQLQSHKLNKKQQKQQKIDETMFNQKNNLKNTYINKITNLIQETKSTVTPKYERKASIYTEDSAQAKLIRNRECARNSRKRKKIYIELLESRVKSLNEELEKSKRIIKGQTTCQQQLGSNQLLQNFVLGRQQLFEKLEYAIKNHTDNNEINLLLDSMRFRVGGGGKERINASNYFFQQIMEICFPIHVRYMLWAATSENQEPTWFTNLSQEINLTEVQNKSLKKQYKRIRQDKDKLEQLIKQFQNVKDNLYSKTHQLENFIDELRGILTPTQIGTFLIGLEKNKYQKEMSISNLWKIFDEEFETEVKEEDSQQQDTQQKKSNNILLLKGDIGKPKPSTRNLPDDNFRYGIQSKREPIQIQFSNLECGDQIKSSMRRNHKVQRSDITLMTHGMKNKPQTPFDKLLKQQYASEAKELLDKIYQQRINSEPKKQYINKNRSFSLRQQHNTKNQQKIMCKLQKIHDIKSKIYQ
ncbi:unnamed protein product [Paramecium primaurelia]|uniref:BZIP domain-containing protein n=1 Tax=Paramecium primaurelia TaxID=5886 RepID=A0A8S1PJA9_PARPR|nr:unnamed protein product [Paramecium primaurelia]